MTGKLDHLLSLTERAKGLRQAQVRDTPQTGRWFSVANRDDAEAVVEKVSESKTRPKPGSINRPM